MNKNKFILDNNMNYLTVRIALSKQYAIGKFFMTIIAVGHD